MSPAERHLLETIGLIALGLGSATVVGLAYGLGRAILSHSELPPAPRGDWRDHLYAGFIGSLVLLVGGFTAWMLGLLVDKLGRELLK